MPLPVHTQLFGGAVGTHEGLGPLDAAQFFSSEDSVNVYVERAGAFGQIRKILGYAKQNSAAITTDTGTSAVKIVGLFPYRSMSGGTTTRHVIAVVDDGANEYEVWVSTDSAATWTFLAELGTDVGMIPSAKQYKNDLYLCDANGVVKKYDGATLGNAGGSQSPTPSAATTGAGPLKGGYTWKLLSLKEGTDRQLASATSSELRLDGANAFITWTEDADTDVKGYELYRRTATGDEFYWVDYIDGRTTASYIDKTSDTNLMAGRTLREFGDPPATGTHFVESHLQRLWWGRTDANPRRVYYSDPGFPDSVGENNYLEFTDAKSGTDQITGLWGNYNEMLVVFQEYSIWRVGGTGSIINNVQNWVRRKTSASVGCVTNQSIVEVPSGAKYTDADGNIGTTSGVTLAYWTPYNTINLLHPGGGGDFADTIISHPKSIYLRTVQFEHRHLIISEHDKTNGHIRWFFPWNAPGVVSNQPRNNAGVMWDYRHGTWSELDTCPFGAACTIEKANDAEVLLVGESNESKGGYIYKNWSGSSYDGTGNDIQADFWTKPFYGLGEGGGPLLEQEKRWKRITIVTGAKSGSKNITIRWYENLAAADAVARGTATVDMQETRLSHGQNRVDLLDTNGDHMRSEAIRIRVGDDSDDSSWAVPVFALSFQVLPGLAPR